jgi:murein L,D-transpeptidase YcbB/YkuD
MMMTFSIPHRTRFWPVLLALWVVLAAFATAPAGAQDIAFRQAVAESASSDDDIAAFYRNRNYAPMWTEDGEAGQARRAALVQALTNAHLHGLPTARYGLPDLMRQMQTARSSRDMGTVEVALSKAFVQYARDIQTGALVPSSVDAGIVRVVPYRDRGAYLSELAGNVPGRYMQSLAPRTLEYLGLMKAKMQLEQVVAEGGWGREVPAGGLEPGDSGDAVVALRNRLIAMGFMDRSVSGTYDGNLQRAVQRFQRAHGLEPDGVAGKGTLAEVNQPAEARLKSVIVAMERERWLNQDRGERHILVNQTDFTAKIIDHGKVTFETRSVIGKNTSDRRSPEFSDIMEHMVINPSWYVPRSIITKEYLPKLQSNPNAVGHLEITDSRGRRVDRSTMDFTQFSARSFPFAMRQPPSQSNALGLVKFMFPNKYNIYLHDTPQKNLFSHEVRAYSHGCIRLADPFDFAYALLSRQTDDPQRFFKGILATGKETKVVLDKPVPVHIIYRTAFTTPTGGMEYRRDVYERDAKIWNALAAAGVALGAVQG